MIFTPRWMHELLLNGDNSFMANGKLGFFVQKNWLVALDVYHANPDNEASSTDYGLSTKGDRAGDGR